MVVRVLERQAEAVGCPVGTKLLQNPPALEVPEGQHLVAHSHSQNQHVDGVTQKGHSLARLLHYFH